MSPLVKLHQSQQPTSLSFLPEELISEILSRLPVKPLMQFKCVCKSWKSLISGTNFAKLHLQISPKNTNLILTLQQQSDHMIKRPPTSIVACTLRSFIRDPSSTIAAEEARHSVKRKYRVLDSCNGLICLCSDFHDFNNELEEHWFRVWNPSIRFGSKKSPRLNVNLRVDQTFLCSTNFGFGYDESSDTYKVVAVICDWNAQDDSHRTKVKVYSWGDSYWKDIQRFPAFPFGSRNDGIFVGGALNWLAIRNMTGDCAWSLPADQMVIVSLDLGKETYKLLSLPDCIGDEVPYFTPTLAVLGGRLSLYHDYNNTHLVVWQMTEFGVENSWNQFVKISYLHPPATLFALVPLCVSVNGDVLVLGDNDKSQIVLYDHRDDRVECIGNFDSTMGINAKDYVQSLARPC